MSIVCTSSAALATKISVILATHGSRTPMSDQAEESTSSPLFSMLRKGRQDYKLIERGRAKAPYTSDIRCDCTPPRLQQSMRGKRPA